MRPAAVRPWGTYLQTRCPVGSGTRCWCRRCCCFRGECEHGRGCARHDSAPLRPSAPDSGDVSSWRSWRRWRAPGPVAERWWAASPWRGGGSLGRWPQGCDAAGLWRPAAASLAPGCAPVPGPPPCAYMLFIEREGRHKKKKERHG